MKPSTCLSCLILLAIISSCSVRKTKEVDPINPGTVSIKGTIEDYDQSYTTGMLYYFDGLARQDKQELVSIDSSGSFITSFSIAHQTSTIYMFLRRYGFNLTVSPNQEYEIRVSNDGAIEFLGENGELNNQLSQITLVMHENFKEKNQLRNHYADSDTISFEEYYKFCTDLARRKLASLEEYCRENQILQEAQQLTEQNIIYEPAWALIAFRTITRDGMWHWREGMPDNLVSILRKDFPINNPDAITSRTYHDYLTNILDIMREEVIASETYIETLRASGNFTEDELSIWKGIYSYDGVTYGTREYQELIRDKGSIEQELFRKENLKKLFEDSATLPKGLGRDFIISQGVMRYCFEIPLMVPSTSDWETISFLISNKTILKELHKQEKLLKAKQEVTSQEDVRVIETMENVKAEEIFNRLLEKYHGKVVYVDFWATWCGPCREELVFSKSLQKHFEDEEVVFLNLCCRSTEETWEEFIQVEQITGENYLLDVDEYNYLSKLFNIQGIPHYVLVDRDGKVHNKKAPRPSLEQTIRSEIQALLDID